MSMTKAIAILAAIVPSSGFAASESADQVMACYHSGATLEEKYSCMGSSISACHDGSSASIAACAKAETKVWQVLMDQEIARIQAILQEKEIISGPCTGNEAGCTQGLKALVSDSADHAEQKCLEEASAPQNGGRPEMAAALCHMREAARTTLRVADFGAGMGQHAD